MSHKSKKYKEFQRILKLKWNILLSQKEMEKIALNQKFLKNYFLLLFHITLQLTLSVFSSRKQAKLLASKPMFPQNPIYPSNIALITLVSYEIISVSMSILGVLCNSDDKVPGKQQILNEFCLKKEKMNGISHCRTLVCYLQPHIYANICCVKFE